MTSRQPLANSETDGSVHGTPPPRPAADATLAERRPLHREPLVHFVVLGALLFALERIAPRAVARDADGEIRVPPSVVAHLRTEHLRNAHRPPTAAEEADAVRAYIDDEIMFRQARAMKLDEGDTVVRRRLIQKAEFLLDDLEPIAEPTDADLESYRTLHGQQFMRPDAASFTHVFVARDRHGPQTEGRAAELLDRARGLAIGAPLPVEQSDPFLAGTTFVRRTERDIDAIFGPGFGKEVRALPLGVASGPIRSAYGLHVVRVSDRAEAYVPPLDQIRGQVRDAWIREARARTRAEAREKLRTQFKVHVELPAEAPNGGAANGGAPNARAPGAGAPPE